MKKMFNFRFKALPMIISGVIFVFLSMSSMTLLATTKFVKVGGSASNNGDSWDTPYASLATALEVAGVDKIYVAEGLYANTTATYSIPNSNMTIQGGFPNSSTGTSIAAYDPATYRTILNGNGFGIFKVVNSYSNNLVIQGFTLTEGTAVSGSVFSAASSTAATASYLFEDLRVLNNHATNGAFFFTTVNGPTVDFKNCEFNNNDAFNGGSIHITTATATTFTIDGCSFNNCEAENGGAIYNTTGPTLYKMKIKNSSFCSNHSSLYGGAIYTTTSAIEITNCTFNNNSAKTNYWGGAIFATTSAVNCTASTFYGNNASLGGAIYQTTGTSGLVSHYDNCKFAYNYAGDQTVGVGAADGGGAMHIEGINMNFTADNSVFYRNSVPGGTFGGAINCSGSAACTSMNGSTFFENRIGVSTTIQGADISSYNGTNRYASIQNSQMQLASSADYLNQTGTATGGYSFGAGNTFSNTTATGGAETLTSASCPATIINLSSAPAATNTAVGTIDCAKTQLSPAPVLSTASQLDLIVTINVTTAGTFTPITVTGSGITVANGITSVTTSTTGIQQFHIPIKYDGTALGTMNFTIGTSTNAGNCTADLTKAPKKAISDVWTLDCVPKAAPSLK